MDKKLKQLIEATVHAVVKEAIPNMDAQDISNTNTSTSMGSQLMQMPGAPSTGNMGVAGTHPMNNESREALKNWMRVAKVVMTKYPDIASIPPDIKTMLEQLGKKFDEYNKVPNSGVGYGSM